MTATDATGATVVPKSTVIINVQSVGNGSSKVSRSDLVNQGQTSLRLVELIEGRVGADSSLEKLNDGDCYGGKPPNHTSPTFNPIDGTVIVFTLNSAKSPRGYDITSIVSTSGSAARGQPRARQHYTIDVAGVGSKSILPLVHVKNLGSVSSEVQVTTIGSSGKPIATGVERVRVTFHATDGEALETMYQELDIFGAPAR